MEWTDLTAYVSAAKSVLDLFKSASALLPKGENKDEMYKFLFDLTDDGNWLVDVHASS